MPYLVILEGNVQGVGCRNYCAGTARMMKMHGSAANTRDGRVRVVINTEYNEKADDFAAALRVNRFSLPFWGRIARMTVEWHENAEAGEYEW